MIVTRHPDWPGLEEPPGFFIGYWDSPQHRREALLPNPEDYVDPAWDHATREVVVQYLKAGRVLFRWIGSSTCRFCGQRPAGGVPEILQGTRFNAACLTDGIFTWPSGFAHYLEEHAVRPPDQFVEHVKRTR